MNAGGSAGGILLLWDKRRISLVDSVADSFSVSCLFRMEDDGFQWVFSGVYGPTEKRLRESFLEELGSIRGLWENPWCVGGDFNEILSPNERSRGGSVTTQIWGIMTGAREWEGIKPPKPVASLTEILIPTIMRSPVNMSTYLYNILRYQTSIGRDEISIPHTSSSYTK